MKNLYVSHVNYVLNKKMYIQSYIVIYKDYNIYTKITYGEK